MKYLSLKNLSAASLASNLTALTILLSATSCFAEGGGGGGGVGGNGASGPEPQSWLFMLIGFSVLGLVAMYRKNKKRQVLEH